MKTLRKTLVILLALLCAAPGLALASGSYDGTIVCTTPQVVCAPFGGAVGTVLLQAGEKINAGDAVATVETTKVYAPCDGTVTGLFGQPGDDAKTIADRFGAVLFIAPNRQYTISATAAKAYGSIDTMYVHIGETVYIRSTDTYDRNYAQGIITAVDGMDFTVETTSGALLMDETVYMFRSSEMQYKTRVGQGTVSRTAEVAMAGEGSIVAMHVQDGDSVTHGQLLYEMVTGTLPGLTATGSVITSDVSGIVESVKIAAGDSIAQGDVLITVSPLDGMRAALELNEFDLADVHEGDPMVLIFNYDETGETTMPGTVEMISNIATQTDDAGNTAVTYTAYIRFAPDDSIRLGMTVTAFETEE
ncbi:MAG TPA: HlyD family efflux transporter periplasmic adaptor subunit [Candidatus Limiplasma sp.]|nr:HlyD family efflux transporter periplasmic adaptor subunit [Candidatus Limiplasma sp.]